MVVTSQPWETIKEQFSSNMSYEAMLKLTEFLISNGYHYRMFGFVFFESLVVCGHQPFELFSYSLHLSFDKESSKYCFEWYEKSDSIWKVMIREDELEKKFRQVIYKTTWVF